MEATTTRKMPLDFTRMTLPVVAIPPQSLKGGNADLAPPAVHPRKFHCTQCKKFLPETSFFPSNLHRHIHRCRMHTREAAKASHRKHAEIAKKRRQMTGVGASVPSWPDMARRVIATTRSKHCSVQGTGTVDFDSDASHANARGVMDASDGGERGPCTYPLPAWLTDVQAVTAIMERFHGKSALSGQSRGLVLVPYAHLTAQGKNTWKAWDSVLVTCSEAKVLACQMGEDREKAFGVGVLDDVRGAQSVHEASDSDGAAA